MFEIKYGIPAKVKQSPYMAFDMVGLLTHCFNCLYGNYLVILLV